MKNTLREWKGKSRGCDNPTTLADEEDIWKFTSVEDRSTIAAVQILRRIPSR
jgi:hypothetical protein